MNFIKRLISIMTVAVVTFAVLLFDALLSPALSSASPPFGLEERYFVNLSCTVLPGSNPQNCILVNDYSPIVPAPQFTVPLFHSLVITDILWYATFAPANTGQLQAVECNSVINGQAGVFIHKSFASPDAYGLATVQDHLSTGILVPPNAQVLCAQGQPQSTMFVHIQGYLTTSH